MEKIAVYGLTNCDTVKKARRWLDAQGLDTSFHDFKKEGADPDRVARWIGEAGLDRVLNRRGTTWRKLSEEDKARAEGDAAIALLVDNPSMIKRPIVEYRGGLLVGFDEEAWRAAFQ